jgi:hypothetical protein
VPEQIPTGWWPPGNRPMHTGTAAGLSSQQARRQGVVPHEEMK